MSKSSKTSLRNYAKYATRKKKEGYRNLLKPYNFCCDINDDDHETRYDQRKPPFASSLTVLSPIHESPTLKFRFESTEPVANAKRKPSKGKSKLTDSNLDGNPCVKTRGPLLWFQEDEIEIAKNQFWSEKQKRYNEEADRNALIGEKRVKKILASRTETAGPRWYQDLSISQMKQVLVLGETITADFEERITFRTQKALAVIGVTSTFVKVAPRVIKSLQRRTRLRPIEFLKEIYKRVTGQYFEDEEYKKTYDSNERIILSAIAFLALPDAVIELNNRLPEISEPVFPPKPKPPKTSPRRSGLYKWPYEEPLFVPPDWVTYRESLDEWRDKCKRVPRPRVILPCLKGREMKDGRNVRETISKSNDKGRTTHGSIDASVNQNPKEGQRLMIENCSDMGSKTFAGPFNLSVPISPDEEMKQTYEFSLSGLGEKAGPVNYEICGTLKPPFPKRKSWLGEKEAHYIVSGISENEDPPRCPVTYVMTGISHVTPENSDDNFFAELKLGDGPRRIYPAGRKNLSKNWQEWLQDADEEFNVVEKEANKLIKSIEATMRLVIPGNRCDACCSCRQTRKANLKAHDTKTPFMVIDSIAESDDQKRYIVGSLAMHSPAPSPAESTLNLLEVVASKETVQKKLLINGITDDRGETIYYISGMTENLQYIPKRTVLKERPPKSLRNVPPCACTIEKIFNEGIAQSMSSDDIPHTKKKGICYGRKYRPDESPAFTCRAYPDDKSCRRNPFDNKLKRGILAAKSNGHKNDESEGAPKEKKMFTLPAFSPCGDDDGMAVCGGPWGARNIPSPEVVAAREAEAKEILRGPPCGDTAGRAVCGGPWGARNPSPKVTRADEEEESEEEKAEGEKEEKLNQSEAAKAAKEAEAQARKLRREQLKRDKLCSERFEEEAGEVDRSLDYAKKPTDYCDYDNPWDKMRTAPTVNPWENEYEKSLRLSQAVPRTSEDHKIGKKMTEGKRGGGEKRGANEDSHRIRSRGNNKRENDDVQVIYSGKQAARDSQGANIQRSDAKPQRSPKDNVEKKNKREPSTGAKKPNHEVRSGGKSEMGNRRRDKTSMRIDCGNNRPEKSSRKNARAEKNHQKQDDSKNKKTKAKTQPSSSSESETRKILNEYKVARAIIPDEPHLPCRREKTGHFDEEFDDCGCSDDGERTSDSHDVRNGLKYGWRTKSQQELPREKTLAYLVEPTDRIETVKVRDGGRPCTCRENRNNKKILIYNVGGAVDVGKGGRGMKYPQVIEGVSYITPPQSPRNSSEYIPEYDILKSQYKMCERNRSDKDLNKYINELSKIRSKKSNADSCPCGYKGEENAPINSSPENSSISKGNGLTSALKDEGLIDHFVSCKDAVPCWLKCAKYSKAGCCEKPKLLEVKKPVCECRYERRVVRREEEKQRWVDRQRRLKGAKKQPVLEVGGTSRPMSNDTKLIISSVKKVIRDGEFIPETRYCVTGIAENYAMGPPQHIIPGISMQTPIVTPEPSKADILCMCGHRHWSPTDITASSKARGDEYPCRGRERRKEVAENCVSDNGKTIKTDHSEPYEAYRSCADTRKSCNAGFDKSGGSSHGKKRKMISGGSSMPDNGNKKLKKLKFKAEKASQDYSYAKGKEEKTVARNDARIANKLGQTATGFEGPEKHRERETPLVEDKIREEKNVGRNNYPQSQKLIVENEGDLFELMKIELEKMGSENFVLAKLPECWLMPQLRSWLEYREGKIYTDLEKKQLCELSRKQWGSLQQTGKPSIPLPSLNLTRKEAAEMTFDRANEMKKKIPVLQAKYFSELRKTRVSEARLYWPTMEFGKFPNLSFKEAYFTYMAGKEADGHVFRPWKPEDTK